MNKTFKLIFNRVRGCVMVVNELTSACQTGKKAAATAAVVATIMASGGAMAANSPWFDETNESISTSIVELLPNQTTFEANPSTDEHVVLYSLHSATSANDPQTISNQSIHFVVTDNEPSASAPITAHTIKVDGGEVNLTGNAVTIGVENRTQNGSMTSVSSAALSVGQFGQGGTVNVASVETEFNASTDSGSVAGVSVQYGGAMHFTGDKVNINAQSSVDEQPVVYDEWDSHYKVSGLQFDSAQSVTTDANTALHVSVTGTGVTNNAANVFGIEGKHDGGVINFAGTTNVTTQSNAGNTIGIYLSSAGVDEASDLGSANVVFNGKTTVKTTAQTAEYAIGLSVGVPQQALESIPVEELTGAFNTRRNEVAFNNGLDITVDNGGKDARGIVVGNQYQTGDLLNQVLSVHGNAQITASGAKRAMGLELEDASNATFNNDVTVQATLNVNPAYIDSDWVPTTRRDAQSYVDGIDIGRGAKASFLGDIQLTATANAGLDALPENVKLFAGGINIDIGAQATFGSAETTTVIDATVQGVYGKAVGVGGYDFDKTLFNGKTLEINAYTSDGEARGMDFERGRLEVNAATFIQSSTDGRYRTVGILSRDSDLTFNNDVSIETYSTFGAWSRGIRTLGSLGQLTFAKDLTIDVNVEASEDEVAPREDERGWGTGARAIHHEASSHLSVLGDVTFHVEGPAQVRGIDLDAGSMDLLSNTTIVATRLNQFEPERMPVHAIDVTDAQLVIGTDDKTSLHQWEVTGHSGNSYGLYVNNNSSAVLNNAVLDWNVQNTTDQAIGAYVQASTLKLNGVENSRIDVTGVE